MDEKKLLNDEELDKVVGGVRLPYIVRSDGTISISQYRACCGGEFYKGDNIY